MANFWQVALSVAGLGALGCFVLWSLYSGVLRLKIWTGISRKDQFKLLQLFIILTFLFAIAALVTYILSNRRQSDTYSSRLEIQLNGEKPPLKEVRISVADLDLSGRVVSNGVAVFDGIPDYTSKAKVAATLFF